MDLGVMWLYATDKIMSVASNYIYIELPTVALDGWARISAAKVCSCPAVCAWPLHTHLCVPHVSTGGHRRRRSRRRSRSRSYLGRCRHRRRRRSHCALHFSVVSAHKRHVANGHTFLILSCCTHRRSCSTNFLLQVSRARVVLFSVHCTPYRNLAFVEVCRCDKVSRDRTSESAIADRIRVS